MRKVNLLKRVLSRSVLGPSVRTTVFLNVVGFSRSNSNFSVELRFFSPNGCKKFENSELADKSFLEIDFVVFRSNYGFFERSRDFPIYSSLSVRTEVFPSERE